MRRDLISKPTRSDFPEVLTGCTLPGIEIPFDVGGLTSHKLVAAPLYLAPKNESLESHLQAILEGLQRHISGLFEVADKAGDRHNPDPHHAKLAINVAFAACGFLLESYDYQKQREERRTS